MKKSAIYTRTGDTGKTSLVGGERILKSDERINLYGDIDELNSSLGIVVSFLKAERLPKQEIILDLLLEIQSSLFNLGSHMACMKKDWEKFKLPKLSDDLIFKIESQIDTLDNCLPQLKNFILPGGSQLSAFTHTSRTICRRVERQLVDFAQEDSAPDNAILFVNRLSDYLFVIARYFNLELGHKEILWNS
jgi:cob(I)alamin adenosyltransferase